MRRSDGSGQTGQLLDRSGVECDVVAVDPFYVTNSADTEERLDRLADHLGRTVRLLHDGGEGVALKDQLAKLHRALLEVVKDDSIDPTDLVHRKIQTMSRPVATIPAPSIPQPFRPIDVSAYVGNR